MSEKFWTSHFGHQRRVLHQKVRHDLKHFCPPKDLIIWNEWMFIFTTGVKIQLQVFDRNANAAVYGETFLKNHPQWTWRPSSVCVRFKTFNFTTCTIIILFEIHPESDSCIDLMALPSQIWSYLGLSVEVVDSFEWNKGGWCFRICFLLQTFRDLCSESFRCGCCGHTISSSAEGSSEVQPSTSLLFLLGPVHLSCRRNMGVQTRGAWVAMAFSDWVSGLGILLIFLMESLAVDATNMEPVYWNSLNRRYVGGWYKTHAPRYKFSRS